MAAAGPLMSFLIAAVLAAFWYLLSLAKAPVVITATLGYGALINAVLGAFNLLPAFPLDGGRVFRGTLWKRSGNLIRSTRNATRVSEVFSLLMMFGGFAAIIFGDFVDGLWIVVLGWFIRSGAETSLKQTIMGEALAGVMVGDIMTRNLLSVPPDLTVQQLITDYFLVQPHGAYPVIQDGQILGLLTLQSVRSVPKEERTTETARQVMLPSDPKITVKPTVSALDAMHKMARERLGRLLVTDNGHLLGIVTRGDLMRSIQMRQDLSSDSILQRPEPWSSSTPVAPGQVRYCVQCGAQLTIGTATCPFCNAKQPQ